jgi:hypothetical protein
MHVRDENLTVNQLYVFCSMLDVYLLKFRYESEVRFEQNQSGLQIKYLMKLSLTSTMEILIKSVARLMLS